MFSIWNKICIGNFKCICVQPGTEHKHIPWKISYNMVYMYFCVILVYMLFWGIIHEITKNCIFSIYIYVMHDSSLKKWTLTYLKYSMYPWQLNEKFQWNAKFCLVYFFLTHFVPTIHGFTILTWVDSLKEQISIVYILWFLASGLSLFE